MAAQLSSKEGWGQRPSSPALGLKTLLQVWLQETTTTGQLLSDAVAHLTPAPYTPSPCQEASPLCSPTARCVFSCLPGTCTQGRDWGREQDKLEVTALTQNYNLGLPVRYSPTSSPAGPWHSFSKAQSSHPSPFPSLMAQHRPDTTWKVRSQNQVLHTPAARDPSGSLSQTPCSTTLPKTKPYD